MRLMAPEFDAIINVADVARTSPIKASLADGFELFDEYERVYRHRMLASMLTAHLASNYLASDGYILFNSTLASYDFNQLPKHAARPSVLQFVSDATVAKQASDLATDRTD